MSASEINVRCDTAKEKLSQLRRGHGCLCVALMSLHEAADLIPDAQSKVRIKSLARGLSKMVPDYLEFQAATTLPKPTYDVR